jgi:hypothetical protein
MSLYGKTKYSLLSAITHEELAIVCDDNKIDVDKTKDAADIWLNDMRAGGRIKKENLIKILTNRKVDITDGATENDLSALVWSSRPDGHIDHDDATGSVAQKMVELERKHEDELVAAKAALGLKNKDEIAAAKVALDLKNKDEIAAAKTELAAEKKKLDDERKALVEERKNNSDDAVKKLEEEHKLKIAAASNKYEEELENAKKNYTIAQQEKFMEKKAADELQKRMQTFEDAIQNNAGLKQILIESGLMDGVSFKTTPSSGSSSSKAGSTAQHSGGFGSSNDTSNLNGIFASQPHNNSFAPIKPNKAFDDVDKNRDPRLDLPIDHMHYRAPGSEYGIAPDISKTKDDAFNMTTDAPGHSLHWTDQDSINYENFHAATHAPELALINPSMKKYALYTLARQFKVSASALKALRDYTAQVRTFSEIPPEFVRDGYSGLAFWTQMSDSILTVSNMTVGQMQALKLTGNLGRVKCYPKLRSRPRTRHEPHLGIKCNLNEFTPTTGLKPCRI